MVFQGYALFPHLKVYDDRRLANLNFPLKIRKFLQEEIVKVLATVTRRYHEDLVRLPDRPCRLVSTRPSETADTIGGEA